MEDDDVRHLPVRFELRADRLDELVELVGVPALAQHEAPALRVVELVVVDLAPVERPVHEAPLLRVLVEEGRLRVERTPVALDGQHRDERDPVVARHLEPGRLDPSLDVAAQGLNAELRHAEIHRRVRPEQEVALVPVDQQHAVVPEHGVLPGRDQTEQNAQNGQQHTTHHPHA